MIRNKGHTPFAVDGHIQAMAALKEHQIELILMDVEMPEMNGFELTKQIRETYHDWIPIIILSSNAKAKDLAKGIDAGADDYLIKPVKEVILTAKIRAMSRIADMQHQLDVANKKLEALSNIDPLTQVVNRRGLEQMLDSVWQINARQDSELSILMFDIDFFKDYNDHYGHPKGDDCLKRVASVLSHTINRPSDFVARYGGEEFIAILPFTPTSGAYAKAEEIIFDLKQAQLIHEYSSVSKFVSGSIGISSTRFNALNYSELIEQADTALYQAKAIGRQQVISFEPNKQQIIET